MLHTYPAVNSIRDEPHFADLLETLLDKNTKVSELNAFREERNKERTVKSRVLSRDIEATKNELQEFREVNWTISLLKDYIDQLQEYKKRLNHIQAMEEDKLVMPQISDNIMDEDGVITATHFTVKEWLLYKKGAS